MRKDILSFTVVALIIALAISATAALHAVTKLPEAALLDRASLEGTSLADYNTGEEVLEAMQTLKTEYLNAQIHWDSEQGSLTLNLADMGAVPQYGFIEAQLQDYLNVSGAAKIRHLVFGRNMTYPLQVDEAILQAAFAETGIEQGVKNATYFYDAGLFIEDHQTGYGIEYEELISTLEADWQQDFTAMESGALPLRSREADITTADLEMIFEDTALLAERELELYGDHAEYWTFAFRDHLDWILPYEGHAFLDENAMLSYASEDLSALAATPAQDVTITLDEEGSVHFEGAARAGREVDAEAFMILLRDAAADPEASTILIPLVDVDPEITVPEELAERGITELLGYGSTNFWGSTVTRIHNVEHGMNLFNGTIVPQGEEFSFTTLMGPIDAANGWLPELVILGPETKKEYGGGLCQVSSTMYRAALYLGLPITSRKNHSYAVSYYAYSATDDDRPTGQGLDATIYDPYPDLRFLNDTPGDILIQGYTEGTNAYFIAYGTKDDRSVTLDGPYAYDYSTVEEPQITYTDDLEPGVRELEEHAHTGFKVNWYRTVTYADGSVSEDTIHSNYEARPAKYLEGTPLEDRETAEESEE